MKAFRKRNSQRELHQSFKSQSAMEYLMTYGWAILIIAVVLAALFELGVFNPMTFAPKASPGSCQVVRPEGAGTTNFISLEGECQGELPQYVTQFNGQLGSYIQEPLLESYSFTLSAWALKSSTVSNLRNGIAGEGWSYGDRYLGEPNGANWGGWCANTSSDGVWYIYGNPVTVGSWAFVVLTFNITTHILTFYQAGQRISNATGAYCTPDLQSTDNIPFRIGNSWGSNEPWDGDIANVQFYNTALSANDVQALYQEGIGGAPIKIQNLIGWWPLNGNANDYSGNGNNGVPSGVTYTSNWYSGYSAP